MKNLVLFILFNMRTFSIETHKHTFFGSLWCVLFVYYGYVRACVWWQWLKFRCVECDNSTKLPCHRSGYSPLGGVRSQPICTVRIENLFEKHLNVSCVCPTIAIGLTKKLHENQLCCRWLWRTSNSLMNENLTKSQICWFVSN